MGQSKLNSIISTLNVFLIIAGFQFFTTLLSLFLPVGVENVSQIVTIPYRAFALGVCILTIALNLKTISHSPVVIKVLFVYWVLIIFRFLYDMFLRTDLNVQSGLFGNQLIFLILVGFLPVVSVLLSYRSINLSYLKSWILWGLGFAAIILFIANPVYQEASEERVGFITMKSIGIGHLGLSSLIMCLFVLFRDKHNLLFKILLGAVSLISFLVFLRAGSRGPVLSAIIISLIAVYSLKKHKAISFALVVFLSLIVFLYLDQILDLLGSISPILENRFVNKGVEQFAERNYFYDFAINSFLKNPLLGHDFAVYHVDGTFLYAHNAFLDSLMQLGIIGGILFLYMVFVSMGRILKTSKTPFFWIGLLLAQLFAKIMVSSSFYDEPSISVLMILLFLTVPFFERKNEIMKNQAFIDNL